MTAVRTGLENFIGNPPSWAAGKRLGLLCNPASVDRRLRHARDLLARWFPGQLTALFSPQHGYFSEKQDNMIESEHLKDPVLGIPVFSLYSHVRKPTEEMLEPIDLLIVDLQDAGCRVYTFIYTLSYCLEAAAAVGKKVVILDRPNPVSGEQAEGNCLRDEFASFVGRYPIPMRHGLTIGELALFFNQNCGIGCDLEIIPMSGWQRSMYFADTGLPWIAPSPNLPTAASAMVYPGQVLWEGTNVSEGRGTCQPFEFFGAPCLDTDRVASYLDDAPMDGVILRPCHFEPTSNKWQEKRCRGFQLHVVDRLRYRPYRTSLLLLQAVYACCGDNFKWKPPPYEYEYEKMPIDLITGDNRIRSCIERGQDILALENNWQIELNEFVETSRRFYLYQGTGGNRKKNSGEHLGR